MIYALETLLAALAGMVLVSVVWLVLLARHRDRARFYAGRLRDAQAHVDDLEHLASAVLSLAQRALPPGRRPELPREAVPAMDLALQEWARDLKELHRRLVVNLHVIAQLRKSEEQLSSRVLELEELLMESPEYEIRARFRSLTAERDYFRGRLVEIQQALGEGGEELAARLCELDRQNAELRHELRQGRRLALVMQRQIALLQREDAERAGIALRGLMLHDVEPGAFESLTDLPFEDPEEYTGDSADSAARDSLADYDRPRAASPEASAAPGEDGDLPAPVAPTAAEGEEGG